MCLFFRQNSGEGFFEEEGNLIPQVFNIFCWFCRRKDDPLMSSEYISTFGLCIASDK